MKAIDNKKKIAGRNQRPAVLSDSLQRKLGGYALAAGAAGVAAMACAPGVEAAPVCKNLSFQIAGNNTLPFNPGGGKFPPFQIANTTFATFTSGSFNLESQWDRGFLTPNTLGAKLLLGKSNFPANLASGASIGPAGSFGKGGSYGLLFTYGVGSPGHRRHGTLNNHQGNFDLAGATNYAGVQFSEGAEVHYGWVRLQVTLQAAGIAKTSVIHYLGWGFESTPNTAIAAGSCTGSGEPAADSTRSSLGMLALGSVNSVR
jgi:hypothetical protein